jgi:putative FmdB family regulatory protein
MPLYEYECNVCGRRFEKIQKFSDPPVDTCPTCGGPVHKLIASPAFQFKGTGWYITDYAKKDNGSGKTASEKETSGADKDTGDKKESPKGDSATTSSSSETASSTASAKNPTKDQGPGPKT